jgi:transposase
MRTEVTKLDFTGQKIFAGIDVHKSNWTLSFETNDLALKTFQQPPEPQVLARYLKKHYPNADYLCGYESGFCGFWIQKELLSMGVNCVVVHSADVPTTHKERIYKRDPLDSKKLARMLRTGDYNRLYIPDDHSLGDRNILRTRRMLVSDLTRYKNRIKALLCFWGIRYPDHFKKSTTHWSKRFIDWLQDLQLNNPGSKTALDTLIGQVNLFREAILKINSEIKSLSREERYEKPVDLLITIPGIGMISAMTILTEIENINRFQDLDHFCSYAALVPTSHSSGEIEINGRITKRGNKVLKTILVEGAWGAVRSDPAMLLAFRKFCGRMDKNKAIIRIARKLANRILFVLKNQLEYQNLKLN